MVSVFRLASLGLIILGVQLHGNPVYLGLAITFALVDFIVPLALAVELGHRGGTPNQRRSWPRHISAASEYVPHQNTFGRAVPHLTSQASRSTHVLPCPARPAPRINRHDVTS
jgi:hypothetical protein